MNNGLGATNSCVIFTLSTTIMSRRETNPHFSKPARPQHEDFQQPPIPRVSQPEGYQQPPPIPRVSQPEGYRQPPPIPRASQREDYQQPVIPRVRQHEGYQQPRPISTAPRKKYRGQPPIPVAAPIPIHEHVSQQPHFPVPPHHEDRVPLRSQQQDHFPFQPEQEDHHHQPPPRRGKSQIGGSSKQHKDQGLRPGPVPGKSRVNFQEPTVLLPPDHPPEARVQAPPHHERRHGGIRFPKEQKSKPITWLGAFLCVIFWLVIIIGGLIVLIVYLVFRPQIPHFDVSSFSLNAAYLDVGYLLNGDFTMLTNFTNPNKKVHVDFSSVIIYLYYGNTLIATQYVEPFSAARAQSRFAYIHMVTSQVPLPLGEAQKLQKQMESNGVLIQVKGVFRARSKLGTILRYSYNLYGLCSVMVTRPPAGMLIKKKCRTKR